ncbi:YncE family protein [Streptomyces coelicoflavus]|uniref:YncE family protein n=1 Tax=Streptomyces coelicoflavus TaxID=285562 RepID=A0A6N9UEQ5_9ACTN|nr:YncE family protein [Streptomyces coelicoflavus]NEB15059.1 YncE family protein [Streptomyces coelicoflavus]
MKRLRTTRRTMIATTALAALALSGAAVTTASADAPEKKSSSKGFTTTVVDFGAYTSKVEVADPKEPEERDPTVDATNNTLAVSPNEKFAVATNSYSNHLVVIHVPSGKKVAEIKGYVSPRNILFAPDSKSFTVSDSARGVVDRISVFGFRVTQRLPLGAGVFGTAQSADGKWLYANNAAADTVTIVDLAHNRPTDVLTGFHEPRQGTKLSHSGDTLFVTNYGTGEVSVVDLENKDADLETIGGFKGLRAVSVNRAGDRLYAANSESDEISVVNLVSGKRTSVHVGDKPYGAALSPDGSVLLSGNMADDTLTAVNTADNSVIGTVESGPKGELKGPRQAISFSADSKTAWVLNDDLTIAEVDVENLKVTDILGD